MSRNNFAAAGGGTAQIRPQKCTEIFGWKIFFSVQRENNFITNEAQEAFARGRREN